MARQADAVMKNVIAEVPLRPRKDICGIQPLTIYPGTSIILTSRNDKYRLLPECMDVCDKP